MASLTIRNLDNHLKERLRVCAAQHSRSMEAEAREILATSLNFAENTTNIAVTIHRRFASLNIRSIPIPPRHVVRNAPDFGE